MAEIRDREGYWYRLALGVEDKAKRIAEAMPKPEKTHMILDVGCADGSLTDAIADRYPNSRVVGIDSDLPNIEQAMKNNHRANVEYMTSDIKDFGSNVFDVVIMSSLLHEVYSRAEDGRTAVVQTILEARRVLKTGGVLVIRDMIMPAHSETDNWLATKASKKIITVSSPFWEEVKDFSRRYGKPNTPVRLNHFLLKYFYKENWEHELRENYTAISREWLLAIMKPLNMDVVSNYNYLSPHLKERWMKDFDLNECDMSFMISSGIYSFVKAEEWGETL